MAERDDVLAKIKNLNLQGEWSDIQHGRQFKTADGGIVNLYETGRVVYQGDVNAPTILLLKGAPAGPASKKRVFVVHGHDKNAQDQLELVLRRLKLDPFVLVNNPGAGGTIIEELEKEIGGASFGIVLMTPDDMGYAKTAGAGTELPRARQNVILEMGMLIARLGRSHVAILRTGNVEIPSDANGILYISYENHVRETVNKLVGRLQAAGFTLDPADIVSAGN